MFKKTSLHSVEEVEQLAAAIAAEITASESAQREVARLETEEDAALIAGDVERKRKIRAKIADAEDEIRRVALVLPDLRQRHEAAKRAKAEADWKADLAAYQCEVAAFAKPFDALVAALDRVDLAFERARASGGDHRAAAMPLPPRLSSGALVLAPDLVRGWLDSVRRMGAVEAPPAPPLPMPAVAVQIAPKAPAPPPEPPRFRLATKPPAPDPEGRATVVVIAAHPANSRLKQNDLLRLPHKEALALVRGKVAEFVDPEALAEPPREIASVFDHNEESAA